MASILFAAGVLSYESIKKSRAKRAEKKAFNDSRFSQLERDNAARIAQLQGTTCFCQTSDWRGGGCETHGYVPAAGQPGGPPAPEYTEVDESGGVGAVGSSGGGRRGRDDAPPYEDVSERDAQAPASRQGAREIYPDYQYRRGQEDGALAERQGAPLPMSDEEVRRINDERRKRMKAGGFTNWVLRRKGRSSHADAVIA